MVSISRETEAETDRRLRQVIAAAQLVVYDGVWCFRESPLSHPPALSSEVLAVVRDEESWSALVPAGSGADGPADTGAAGDTDTGEAGEVERFGLFSFHFPPGLDNSGFVGWLASHLKRELGTGVFVVCGSNRRRGGVYDYNGCPIEVFDQVLAVVESLRASAGPAAPATPAAPA